MEPPASQPAPAPQEKPGPPAAPTASVPAPLELQPKRSKKEDRQHKKDDKSAELFLKSLNGIQNADEKISIVSKKFAEVADENKRLHTFIKQSDKRFAIVSKEKEQLQLEYNRTVLVKSKLENLCRELQKQNKSIKDESMLKIREEEERRKETQAKFQSTLTEITALLQQNNEKNSKLRDDNISMTEKFKSVVEQYQLREQQVEKMAKQMSLEQQLSEAKLAKASLEAQADRERLMTEIAQHKLELSQCHARMMENQETEASLRSQIAVYTDKYDEFQNALVKSNQVFGGFKGEMEKMSKKIVKLEKESLSWKKRWEGSQAALLEMATDKRLWDERCAASERQVAQLQRLCRTMQSERTLLLNTLKEHNIERPPLPVLPPAPPAPPLQPSAPSKVDTMAANCAQLKQSLAQLQNQLNVLTTKKEEENQAKVEQQTTTKSKKGKGKKNKADKEKALQESIDAGSSQVVDKPTGALKENVVPITEMANENTVITEVANETTVASEIPNETIVTTEVTNETIVTTEVTNEKVSDAQNFGANEVSSKCDSVVVTVKENIEVNTNNNVNKETKQDSPVVEMVSKVETPKNVLTNEAVVSNSSDIKPNGTAETEFVNGKANGEIMNETAIVSAKPLESQEVVEEVDSALNTPKTDLNTDIKEKVSDSQTTKS